jgi:hypothetical protein
MFVAVPMSELPDWLPAWCLDHLGGPAAAVLFQRHHVLMVFGLRLAGGMDAWDHTGCGVWPAMDVLDSRDQSAVPDAVVEVAERTGRRMRAGGLPCVLGHADFEAQNLRWRGQQLWAVHDWDSLAWQPEAALVGAASGAFATDGPPMLAPVDSSEAFLRAYQDVRGRVFTAVEREIAWAASLWTAAYNARELALYGNSGPSDTLHTQAAERLRRAGVD